MTPPSPGFDRDGHLSELALARYLYGEADAHARAAVDAHVATCASCAAYLAASVAEDEAAPEAPAWLQAGAVSPASTPARAPIAITSRADRLARAARQLGPWLAAAAAALLLVRPWQGGAAPERDHYTRRGSTLGLSVHVHDGAASHLVDSGAKVRAGDRARFEVIVAEDGYLLVAGLDDRGNVYAGFPQESGAAAVFVQRSAVPRVLPSAIEFDATQGSEHLFAMLCSHPFHLDDMRAAMLVSLTTVGGVVPPPDCTLRRLDLVKAPSL